MTDAIKKEPLPVFDGTALNSWRQRMGWSVSDAAEALGCHRDSIKHWESDAPSPPRYIDLACQALALGMTSRARAE